MQPWHQANWNADKRGKEGHSDRSYFINICAPLANNPSNDGGNVMETNYGSTDVTEGTPCFIFMTPLF